MCVIEGESEKVLLNKLYHLWLGKEQEHLQNNQSVSLSFVDTNGFFHSPIHFLHYPGFYVPYPIQSFSQVGLCPLWLPSLLLLSMVQRGGIFLCTILASTACVLTPPCHLHFCWACAQQRTFS